MRRGPVLQVRVISPTPAGKDEAVLVPNPATTRSMIDELTAVLPTAEEPGQSGRLVSSVHQPF
jgi:hypothetical protein